MPDIQSIPEVLYQADQPYHVHYDNLPLRNILDRIGLVNIQVDINTDILRGASGSAGSLNARLDNSLDAAGNIKTDAVDDANHSMASHMDGDGFVRMTDSERAKLQGVLSEANKLEIEIEDYEPGSNNFVTIPPSGSNGVLKFRRSSTIFMEFQNPDTVRLHSVFPPDAAHRHNHNLIPAYDIPSGPTFKNYRTTAVNTPFKTGSLRVYVNGLRMTGVPVKVLNYLSVPVTIPNSGGIAVFPAAAWINTNIASENPAEGTFELNRSLSPSDVIRIDFDEMILPPQAMSSSSSSGAVSSSSSSAPPTPTPTLTPTLTSTPTQTPTPTPTPFEWTVQPSNQYLSSEVEFDFSYQTRKQIPNRLWKYSDDGVTWLLETDSAGTFFSSINLDGIINANGSLVVTNPGSYVPGRKYRVELYVLGGETIVSQVAEIITESPSSSSSTPTPTLTPTQTPTPTPTLTPDAWGPWIPPTPMPETPTPTPTLTPMPDAWGPTPMPEFGSTTVTADGFTVQITNYDAVYFTWDSSVTSGSVAISSTGLVTVTGVAPGTSSTATITMTRPGYAGGSADITAITPPGAALTPTFGSTTATADGFTVVISNYDAAYIWFGTATASGSVAISGTGLVTVTGVAPGTSSTATIMNARSGYAGGSADVTASSST